MNTGPLLARIAADWARRRPDLDARPMLRLILLARAARAAAARVEAVQRQHGLNPAGADLLLTLYRSAPPGGLTPGELTALMAVGASSVTNRLDRLAASGLIERLPDPGDARVRRVRLTGAGVARVEALLPEHLQGEAALLSGLTEAEQAELERLLLRLVQGLEEQG